MQFQLYEQFKCATIVGEARANCATRDHMRYEIPKKNTRVFPVLALIMMATTATKSPLVEGWCSDGNLGVVGEASGRRPILRPPPGDSPSARPTLPFRSRRCECNCRVPSSIKYIRQILFGEKMKSEMAVGLLSACRVVRFWLHEA